MFVPIDEFGAVVDRNKEAHKDKPAFVIHGVDKFGSDYVWVDSVSGKWIWSVKADAEQIHAEIKSAAYTITVKALAEL
jgi:hypothetical protein